MGIEGLIGLGFGLFWGVFITHFYYVRNRIRENPPEGKHYLVDTLGIKLYPTEGIDFGSRTYLKNVKIPFVDGEDFRITAGNWITTKGIKYHSFAPEGISIKGV